MKKISYLLILLFGFLVCYSSSGFAQERVRIATYNILDYPNQVSTKNPKFKLILENMDPDILVVEEITSQAAVDLFKNEVLGQKYKAGTFINGPDTDNAIFFKDSLFHFISTGFIAPSQGPRYISVFKLYHKITLDTLIIYAAHFKASQGDDNEQRRLNEAATLRVFTDMLSLNTNFILVGDLNLYRSSEPAYQELLDQSSSGYFLDPVNRPGQWHDGSSFADLHTQATRLIDIGDGGSQGGLDDRFDFILVSQQLITPGGIDYVDGSYWAYGNDGLHFNLPIQDPPNQAVSTEIAIALYIASDHLPVEADFDFGVVSDVRDEETIPDKFVLFQNYPNPFNPSTKIKFTIPLAETHSNASLHTTLKVYDVLGNEIETLLNEEKPAGTYEITFDASGLPSGIYFYRLRAGSFIQTKQMLLLK